MGLSNDHRTPILFGIFVIISILLLFYNESDNIIINNLHDNIENADQIQDITDVFHGDDWNRFLFITGHGNGNSVKSNDIRVFDFDESQHFHLHSYALSSKLVKALDLQNLRGMKVVGNVLFLANAHSTKSKILITDKCMFKSNQTKEKYAKTFAVDGLDHPYGLAYAHGILYVTSQNTHNVIAYHVKEGPGASGEVFAKVQYPRGIAVDLNERLWVASTRGAVYIYELSTGELVQSISLSHPVGVAFDRATATMIVGCVSQKHANIQIIDSNTFKILKILTTPSPYKLTHPSGIAVIEEQLFVLAQDERILYGWNLTSSEFMGPLLEGSDLPALPEQVAVIRCYDS